MIKQGKSKTIEFLDKLSAIFVNIPEANYGSRLVVFLVLSERTSSKK